MEGRYFAKQRSQKAWILSHLWWKKSNISKSLYKIKIKWSVTENFPALNSSDLYEEIFKQFPSRKFRFPKLTCKKLLFLFPIFAAAVPRGSRVLILDGSAGSLCACKIWSRKNDFRFEAVVYMYTNAFNWSNYLIHSKRVQRKLGYHLIFASWGEHISCSLLLFLQRWGEG